MYEENVYLRNFHLRLKKNLESTPLIAGALSQFFAPSPRSSGKRNVSASRRKTGGAR